MEILILKIIESLQKEKSVIIEYFQTLTQIPHCSRNSDAMVDFLRDFASQRGYRVLVDENKNILIFKGAPKLSLQAHYDMVCIGKAPTIETTIENGWMFAKDSSLGADNGVAIAMMMVLMDEGLELEFVITADEEVGLIGANALAFELQSEVMLNLDSEEEAEVCIGCAGGVDITATLFSEHKNGIGDCYEVSISGLLGGHSGVDIDKGIPSAIKLLGEFLYESKVTQIASFSGGERRNAIASSAVAVVYSLVPLESKGEIRCKKIELAPSILSEGEKLIALIAHFRHGVHQHNETLGIPDTSINLAIINTKEDGKIVIESSARAMSDEGLRTISDEMERFLTSYGCEVLHEDKYPSWKPEQNDFTQIVDSAVKKVFGASKMTAIHAGLECGVIAKKYLNMQFASIGPTIRYPHSIREKVHLDSVKRTFEVVCEVIRQINQKRFSCD